jgi:hypothetical protein
MLIPPDRRTSTTDDKNGKDGGILYFDGTKLIG